MRRRPRARAAVDGAQLSRDGRLRAREHERRLEPRDRLVPARDGPLRDAPLRRRMPRGDRPGAAGSLLARVRDREHQERAWALALARPGEARVHVRSRVVRRGVPARGAPRGVARGASGRRARCPDRRSSHLRRRLGARVRGARAPRATSARRRVQTARSSPPSRSRAYAAFAAGTPTFWPIVLVACALPWLPLPGRPQAHPALLMSVSLLATTALAHAIFFGEDRYHMVATPGALPARGSSAAQAPGARAARTDRRRRHRRAARGRPRRATTAAAFAARLLRRARPPRRRRTRARRSPEREREGSRPHRRGDRRSGTWARRDAPRGPPSGARASRGRRAVQPDGAVSPATERARRRPRGSSPRRPLSSPRPDGRMPDRPPRGRRPFGRNRDSRREPCRDRRKLPPPDPAKQCASNTARLKHSRREHLEGARAAGRKNKLVKLGVFYPEARDSGKKKGTRVHVCSAAPPRARARHVCQPGPRAIDTSLRNVANHGFRPSSGRGRPWHGPCC